MRKKILKSIVKKVLCLGVLIVAGAILSKAEADNVVFRSALESENPISAHSVECTLVSGDVQSRVKIGKSVLRIRDEIRKNISHMDFMEYNTAESNSVKYYLTPIGYKCDESRANKLLLDNKRRGPFDYVLAPIKVVFDNGNSILCQIQLYNAFVTSLDVPIVERELEPFEPVPSVEITEDLNGSLLVKRICPIQPITQYFFE